MPALSLTEKREIQYKLRIYISSFSSQKRASTTIQDCSEATIIAMLSPEETLWDKISDKMWMNVAAQVGGVVDFDRLVETKNFKILSKYFQLAKAEGASFAIVGNAGWGKSYCAKYFAAMNRKNGVVYLEGAEYWTRTMFIKQILLQLGYDTYWKGPAEMMEILVREIRKHKNALIIMDEVDKLPDQVLKFFITIYNKLNKHCGIVWLSTDAIEKRITRGIESRAIGYEELFSRIGAQFIRLKEPSIDEVEDICKLNGVKDATKIARICNEVKDLKGDLRRVERNILKERISR